MSEITENVPTEQNEIKSGPLLCEDIKKAIIEQIKYTFTKEYLTTDAFLLDHMDADFSAPVTIIKDIPLIKSLTTNLSLIIEAIRETDSVIFDEQNLMVKPACKLMQRNTIILRNIPMNTPPEAINQIFGNLEKFVSAIEEMKPEYGENYFIKFKNEEITLEAFAYLREQTFNNQPIQARIKSENLRKSFYYYSPPTPYYNGSNPYYDDARNSDNGEFYPRAYKGNTYTNEGYHQRNYDGPAKEGRFSNNRRRGKDFKGRRGQGSTRKVSNTIEKPEVKQNSSFSMAHSHWPPLPSNKEETLTCGYNGEFTQYPKEQFIEIINNLQEDVKPKWNNESVAILEKGGVHKDLEISKPVPEDAEVEWLEGNNRRKFKGQRPPHTSQTPVGGKSQTKESLTKPKEEPIPSVWPAINMSSVKSPPNSQKRTTALAPKQLNNQQKEHDPKRTHNPKPQQKRKSHQKKKYQQSTEAPKEKDFSTPTQDVVSLNSSDNNQSPGPSYADITRSNYTTTPVSTAVSE